MHGLGVVLFDVVEEDELVGEPNLRPLLARVLLGEETGPPAHGGVVTVTSTWSGPSGESCKIRLVHHRNHLNVTDREKQSKRLLAPTDHHTRSPTLALAYGRT